MLTYDCNSITIAASLWLAFSIYSSIVNQLQLDSADTQFFFQFKVIKLSFVI